MKARLVMGAVVLCAALSGCSDRSNDAEAQQIDALRARLEKLETQVSIARDVSSIKKLQRAYGYYLDKGKADDMADLFTDNQPVAEYEAGAFLGKDSIRKAFHFLGQDNQLPEGKMMTHMQLQGVVHVAPDGKTAQARWRAFAMTANAGQARWQEGPYEVQYVKEDGIWKIQNLHWYQTFTANYEGGWVRKRPAPSAAATASRAATITLQQAPTPDRPASNKSWPDVVIPPYHYKNPVSGR